MPLNKGSLACIIIKELNTYEISKEKQTCLSYAVLNEKVGLNDIEISGTF